MQFKFLNLTHKVKVLRKTLCPLVSLPVYPLFEVFLRFGVLKFSDRLHEVRVSSNFKWRNLIFEKNLILDFLSQKGPKLAQNEVFQVLWKTDAWNSLHEVTATLSFKIEANYFGGKNLLSFWTQMTKICIRWSFSSFMKS